MPYLLHFLDSFDLGGMRDLVVAPEHLALRNGAKNGTFRAPAESLETFPYHLKWQIPGAFRHSLGPKKSSGIAHFQTVFACENLCLICAALETSPIWMKVGKMSSESNFEGI